MNLMLAESRKEAPAETRLLLEAFEMFTHASSSLETAFQQLQIRAKRLSDELEEKNRELEKSLRAKEEVENYLNTILESLPCGVVVLDEDERVTICNPMARQILAEDGGSPVRLGHLLPEALSGIFSGFADSSARQGTREVEVPFSRGGETRFIAVSGTPLSDRSGSAIGMICILRDITEMKVLQERSKRAERLSAMGEMAVELAHEIRNPLGSIELFASLLEQELPHDTDSGRWAANIRIGSRSLNNIVSNMLHFANPPAPTLAEVDIHKVIQEIHGFTDVLMRQRNVLLQRKLTARAPFVRGDRELLKQMFLNLILNAMQAMPSQGSLLISTRNIRSSSARTDPPCLELSIQDSGLGIPPENIDRIFDPFFTTNKKGTGLGLSVVHQIVDRHSGFITVESRINVGTTFTISLPGAHPAQETE
jgi:signal transduction histidine kinase